MEKYAGAGAPPARCRFAMSDTAGGDCVRMPAAAECGQGKAAPRRPACHSQHRPLLSLPMSSPFVIPNA